MIEFSVGMFIELSIHSRQYHLALFSLISRILPVPYGISYIT